MHPHEDATKFASKTQRLSLDLTEKCSVWWCQYLRSKEKRETVRKIGGEVPKEFQTAECWSHFKNERALAT